MTWTLSMAICCRSKLYQKHHIFNVGYVGSNILLWLEPSFKVPKMENSQLTYGETAVWTNGLWQGECSPFTSTVRKLISPVSPNLLAGGLTNDFLCFIPKWEMGKWFPIWRAYFFKWVGEKPPPIEFYHEDYYKIGEACLNPSIAWQVAKLGANGYPSLKRLYWQVVSNIFIFTPILGEDFQFDEPIFQLGWFNHQLV